MAGAVRLGRAGVAFSSARQTEHRLPLPGRPDLVLGPRTLIMGIVNVTPDSFSDGGRWLDTDAAVEHGLRLAAAGADLLDVGGESTRPGADPVSVDEERRRVLPVIEALAARTKVPLSVDTTKGEIAGEALAAGASLLNDVSTLRRDPAVAVVAAETGAPLILMHSRGTPATMAARTDYPEGVVETVVADLRAALATAEAAGCPRQALLIDPGIGFAKTTDQSLALLARLGELATLARPVVAGVSRKSFIGRVLDLPVDDRLEGTLAAETAAVLGGAHILRTHDVAASRRAAALTDALHRTGDLDAERHGRAAGRMAS